MLRLYTLIIISLLSLGLSAQIIDRKIYDLDSLIQEYDSKPSFRLYKDNYFVFGTTLAHTPTATNSNIKFQISFSQRLTRSTLPWDTNLFLFYSQKCFWNILDESMPMTDINFNPGIGIAKPLFSEGRFIGKAMLMLEHESNGKDSIYSRSWNKISLGANIIFDPQMIVHGKIWIPIIDGENNKDILNYCGIFQAGASFTSTNKKMGISFNFVKLKGWNLNYNTTIEISYRFSQKDSHWLFMQYYNGYGEGLLNYKQHQSMLRVGFVIKPRIFSEF